MSPQSDPGLGEKLVVRRGRVDSVDLYEIKEHELDMLEKGSPASLQLNFAIFLLSLAFSAILTLTTATVQSSILETVYVVISVVGILLGGYLLFMWWRTKQSNDAIVAKIRNRIPPEVLQAQAQQAASQQHRAVINPQRANKRFHATPSRHALEWLRHAEGSANYQRNYALFMQRYPDGLTPYIVGVPVIA